MSSLHEVAAGSARIWAMAGDHLWQSAILVAVAALICAMARQSPARVRYRIWLVAAVKLAVPSITLAILIVVARGVAGSSAPAPPESSVAKSLLANLGVQLDVPPGVYEVAKPFERLPDIAAGAAQESSRSGRDWFFGCLSAVWLLGTALTAGNWLRRRRQFHGLIQAAAPQVDDLVGGALAQAKTAAGVTRDIAVVISDRAGEPGVWGVWKPVIVIPDRVIGKLSQEELEAVLVHELIHVKRRDNLIGNLTMMLYSVLWFFPAMWLVDRRLLLERERACDERALELGADARTYAAAILKVSKSSLEQSVAGVSCASGSNLTRRLKFIMANDDRADKDRTDRRAPAGASPRFSWIVPGKLITAVMVGAFIATMAATAMMERTRASAQIVEEGIVAALAPSAQSRSDRDKGSSGRKTGTPTALSERVYIGGPVGIWEITPDGVARRVPDGPGASYEGISGLYEGTSDRGIWVLVPGQTVGGVPGGVPGGIPGGVPGGVPGGIPGGVPGAVPGSVPGGVPGGVAGELRGVVQRTAIQEVTGQLPVTALNGQGSPVTIGGASVQTIRVAETGPAPASSEDGAGYHVRLALHVTNDSDRVVSGVALEVTGLEQIRGSDPVNCYAVIRPQLMIGFRTWVGDGQVTAQDAAGVRIKVAGVRFEDGTVWGSLPPAPNPSAITGTASSTNDLAPAGQRPAGIGPTSSHPPSERPPSARLVAPPPESAGASASAMPASGASASSAPASGAPASGVPASGASSAPATSLTPSSSSVPGASSSKTIRRSSGVLHGTAVNRVLPTYPQAAKAAGISGGVAVELVIDEQGNVEEATAVSGPEELREAAVEAARQWRWNPMTVDGVAVKVTGRIAFGFSL